MAQKFSSPQDLFAYDLAALRTAEQTFLEGMPAMLESAQDETVRQALQAHMRETQQQVQNIDQIFQSLGVSAQDVPNASAQGLIKDFQQGLQAVEGGDGLTAALVVAASMKGEHYEIACYTGLVEKAQLMGNQEAVQLLQQNLQQEQAQAQRLESASRQVGQQLIQG